MSPLSVSVKPRTLLGSLPEVLASGAGWGGTAPCAERRALLGSSREPEGLPQGTGDSSAAVFEGAGA